MYQFAQDLKDHAPELGYEHWRNFYWAFKKSFGAIGERAFILHYPPQKHNEYDILNKSYDESRSPTIGSVIFFIKKTNKNYQPPILNINTKDLKGVFTKEELKKLEKQVIEPKFDLDEFYLTGIESYIDDMNLIFDGIGGISRVLDDGRIKEESNATKETNATEIKNEICDIAVRMFGISTSFEKVDRKVSNIIEKKQKQVWEQKLSQLLVVESNFDVEKHRKLFKEIFEESFAFDVFDVFLRLIKMKIAHVLGRTDLFKGDPSLLYGNSFVPILYGNQGIGKTRFIYNIGKIFGDLFVQRDYVFLADIDRAITILSRVPLVYVPETNSLGRVEKSQIKSLITTNKITYRKLFTTDHTVVNMLSSFISDSNIPIGNMFNSNKEYQRRFIQLSFKVNHKRDYEKLKRMWNHINEIDWVGWFRSLDFDQEKITFSHETSERITEKQTEDSIKPVLVNWLENNEKTETPSGVVYGGGCLLMGKKMSTRELYFKFKNWAEEFAPEYTKITECRFGRDLVEYAKMKRRFKINNKEYVLRKVIHSGRTIYELVLFLNDE